MSETAISRLEKSRTMKGILYVVSIILALGFAALMVGHVVDLATHAICLVTHSGTAALTKCK
jgi:hypothetical protein